MPVGARPMRLVFVAHPNSVHTRRWVGWFARAGHHVTIVDPVGVPVEPELPTDVAIAGLEPLAQGLPLLRMLRLRSQMRHRLLQLRPDVVHAHYLARFGWSAALAGVRPLVVSPWGSDLLQVSRRRLRTRLWNRFTLSRADLVTVSSEAMRAAALAAGARDARIRVVHHGVDTAAFSAGEVSPTFRDRLRVAAGTPIVLSPRTVAPLYRHDVVVEAVAELSLRRTPAPMLVLTAQGARPDTLEDLRARAHARGIADRLRILDGVDANELPNLYRAADVVVSVPETDSFAVTLLEAMACGCPIVAGDVPAVTPVLGALDPVARELIVPVGEVAATSAAIERALDLDPAVRTRLASALRGHVVRTAEYDTNMAAMEAIYRDLASAHR